jgi:hypothetical protein
MCISPTSSLSHRKFSPIGWHKVVFGISGGPWNSLVHTLQLCEQTDGGGSVLCGILKPNVQYTKQTGSMYKQNFLPLFSHCCRIAKMSAT